MSPIQLFIVFLLLNFQNVVCQNKPTEPPARYFVNIIKELQKAYVRESYGEDSYQCFTDFDLKNFVDGKNIESIKTKLSRQEEFISQVCDLQKMDSTAKAEVIKKCKATYKKTWAELGQITSKGQTTAGQKAEKMIASAVADLIKETMIRKCRQGK